MPGKPLRPIKGMKSVVRKIARHGSTDSDYYPDGTRAKTNWGSIYVVSLIGFLGTVQSGAIGPTIWPYLQIMDDRASPSFFGYMKASASFGNILAAATAGYLSNVFNQTRPPMIGGKMFMLCACFIYLSIELLRSHHKWAFLFFELLMGIAGGALSILRAHVAMVSTEEDRSRAISISHLAPALGIIVGPALQGVFSQIEYPGWHFLFGTHINMYTAPAYLTLLCTIGGILLLVYCFHASWVPKNPQHVEELKHSRAEAVGKLDKLAIVVCLFTRLFVGTVGILNSTVGTPYTMMVFEWTSGQAVLFHSVVHALGGLIQMAWIFAYIYGRMNSRITERKGICVAIFFIFLFFLITYPWSLYGENIDQRLPSQHNHTSVKHNLLANDSLLIHPHHGHPLGCVYDWCHTTPALNVWVYHAALIICLSTFHPLLMLNLDILFSKLLGPIKQGTMQGFFIVCGDILHIVGPIAMSNVYTRSGPSKLWVFELVGAVLILGAWILFYRRMVPFSEKEEGKEKGKREEIALSTVE